MVVRRSEGAALYIISEEEAAKKRPRTRETREAFAGRFAGRVCRKSFTANLENYLLHGVVEMGDVLDSGCACSRLGVFFPAKKKKRWSTNASVVCLPGRVAGAFRRGVGGLRAATGTWRQSLCHGGCLAGFCAAGLPRPSRDFGGKRLTLNFYIFVQS